jgi:hypothetical protein
MEKLISLITQHLAIFGVSTGLVGAVIRHYLPSLISTAQAKLSGIYTSEFSWIFGSLAGKLDYNALPPEKRDKARVYVQNIIIYAVRLLDLIMPDDGLGAQKKQSLMLWFQTIKMDPQTAGEISDFIDFAVKSLKEQAAKSAMDAQSVAAAPASAPPASSEK